MTMNYTTTIVTDINDIHNADLPVLSDEIEVEYLARQTGADKATVVAFKEQVIDPLRAAYDAGEWTGFPFTTLSAEAAFRIAARGFTPAFRAVRLHRNRLEESERVGFDAVLARIFPGEGE